MHISPQSADAPAPIKNFGWNFDSSLRARSLCADPHRSSAEINDNKSATGMSIKHSFANGSAVESIRTFA